MSWVVFGGTNSGKTYRILEHAKRNGGLVLCNKKNIDMIIEAGIQPSHIKTLEETVTQNEWTYRGWTNVFF